MNNSGQQPSERRYKAFISYRHKPLDSEVAGKLHKRIERYVIPSDLRKEGEKKLGLVFRDQEELPIADDLDENIRLALDRSEFLIVICTPDTPGSVWVQREISYFLEHHSRNHILTVLAAGTPAESFPSLLTEKRDESGNLLERVEPLAANIAADSARVRNRLFRTESLRILASLIGCPYDALYRREQRFRMQRLLALFAAVTAVAAAFVCLLLNRNARIHEQLLMSKQNESRTLAALSQNALREGDYRGALENALDALPGRDPERPYEASAEEALSSALFLCRHGMDMRLIQSCEQDTEIRVVAISPDQSVMATGDPFGKICLYDIASGRLLWSMQHTQEPKYLEFIGDDLLLVRSSAYGHVCLSTDDGSEVWSNEEAMICAVSPESGTCLCYILDDGSKSVWVMDAKTGETVRDLGRLDDYSLIEAAALSSDGRFAALIVPAEKGESADLWIFDLLTGEGKKIEEGLYCHSLAVDYTLKFGKNGDLAAAACGDQSFLQDREGWDSAFLKLYDAGNGWSCRATVPLDFGTAVRGVNGLIDTSDYMDFMDFGNEGIAMASKNRLVMVDAADGTIRWFRDLPGYVVSGNMLSNDSVGLVLSNGLVTMCSASLGNLGYDIFVGYYLCDFPIAKASGTGELYSESINAVVSEEARNRAVCIAFCGPEGSEPFPASDRIPEGSAFYFSPSGRMAAAVYTDYDNNNYRITVIDLSGEKEPAEMTTERLWSAGADQSHIFLTEGGKLIMGGRIYDPAEGTEIPLKPVSGGYSQTLTDSSCRHLSDLKVLTASVDREEDGLYYLCLWEDGEPAGRTILSLQPDQGAYDPEYMYCTCTAVSAAGAAVVYAQDRIDPDGPREYAVYLRGEDRWTEAPFLDSGKGEVLTLAEDHLWMAVQRTNGSLALFDLTDGSQILGMESGIPAVSVTKMMFAGEDKFLVVFTRAGELAVFSTEDGRMLHRSRHGNINLGFYADARYDVQVLPQKNRMLVICDDSSYREPVCISIDLDTFEMNGVYITVSGYLPLLDRVVSDAYREEPCFYPLYTVEELQQMAEDILAEGVPGTAGEEESD